MYSNGLKRNHILDTNHQKHIRMLFQRYGWSMCSLRTDILSVVSDKRSLGRWDSFLKSMKTAESWVSVKLRIEIKVKLFET